MILSDLDAAFREARKTVNRSIGQHVRHAHAHIRKLVDAYAARSAKAGEVEGKS